MHPRRVGAFLLPCKVLLSRALRAPPPGLPRRAPCALFGSPPHTAATPRPARTPAGPAVPAQTLALSLLALSLLALSLRRRGRGGRRGVRVRLIRRRRPRSHRPNDRCHGNHPEHHHPGHTGRPHLFRPSRHETLLSHAPTYSLNSRSPAFDAVRSPPSAAAEVPGAPYLPWEPRSILAPLCHLPFCPEAYLAVESFVWCPRNRGTFTTGRGFTARCMAAVPPWRWIWLRRSGACIGMSAVLCTSVSSIATSWRKSGKNS